jgi:hypothetical protein
MKSFSKYMNEREELEFGTGGEPQVHDTGGSPDDALHIAVQKYPAKVHKFLKDLAEKDADIKRALGGNNDPYPKDPHDDEDEPNEIVPPSADGSSGGEEFE